MIVIRLLFDNTVIYFLGPCPKSNVNNVLTTPTRPLALWKGILRCEYAPSRFIHISTAPYTKIFVLLFFCLHIEIHAFVSPTAGLDIKRKQFVWLMLALSVRNKVRKWSRLLSKRGLSPQLSTHTVEEFGDGGRLPDRIGTFSFARFRMTAISCKDLIRRENAVLRGEANFIIGRRIGRSANSWLL